MSGDAVEVKDEVRPHMVELERQLDRLQLVYALADSVTRADDLEEIYKAAAAGLLRSLGADRVAILTIDPDGVMRFKFWHGLSDRYRKSVEGHSPWKADEPDPKPVL